MEILGFVTVGLAIAALLFDLGFWSLVALGHRRWRRGSGRSPAPETWPRVGVVVCLKAPVPRLLETIRSLENQDYPGDWHITFVTEATADEGDEAAAALAESGRDCRRSDHVVAGRVLEKGERRAQKNHNLLAGLAGAEQGRGPFDAWAFLDGDLVARPDWLREMIRPIATGEGEASTSFHDVSAPGRKIAEALHVLAEASQSFAALVYRGSTWGGSMAIRAETFRRCGLAESWGRAVVDDTAMSRVLREFRLRVVTVPRFLVSSREAIPEYRNLVRWLSRQYFFVKVYLPFAWRLLWMKSWLSLLVLGLAGFHGAWRVLQGEWPAGSLAGWLAVAGGVGVFASTAWCRFFLPGVPPLKTWIPANLLFAGTSVLACADAKFRRKRLTWRDVTYELDGQGRVAVLSPADGGPEPAPEPVPGEAAA